MIVQDSFFIPDDIATGLATGQYRRIGSVVRYAVGPKKGQIVKHLPPINIKKAEQAKGIGKKTIQYVAKHKKEVGIAAIGTIVVSTSTWVYSKGKNMNQRYL